MSRQISYDEIIRIMSGQDHPDQNGLKVFNRDNDAPFIGARPPLYRNGEKSNVKKGGVFHAAVFNLAVQKDLDEYTKLVSTLYTNATSGKSAIVFIDRKCHNGNWKVYIEWIDFVKYDAAQVEVPPTYARK